MSASVIDRFRELVVDESDPFYFDHPLDHVPGMLLFSGLLDLAVRADELRRPRRRAPGRVVAGLDFTRFCELDRATTLSCRPMPGPNRAWTVEARQAGETVCEGSIAFADDAPAVPGGSRGTVSVPPRQAPAELVHRHRPENILVGEPVRRGRGVVEAAVLQPPAGPEPPSPHRGPVEIVEAGRQFATMLEHQEHGKPMDATLLWVALRLDIPFRIDRDVPLLLRWPIARVPGRRSRCAATLAHAATGDELGSLTYEAYAVDPEQYARTRAR
ncbi:A-factor biosynthesis hotdog protein [Actinomadura hallensis]|uniref:A-factor biosynthesis hotdog protein n=1 Tax=Actinomadura hallensis TaxID=337895 RepID=A0A543IH09_9ACTN|nr:AfsA-related hotdog domain-containing protein [Actinomadura hallensis]TQM69858.1 A-factor biosynthesis hotdog protein [Actinomadura hallensis]HLV73170.1 AfsA-related hotdog domain-containing protein [Vulgatibacteraceae bacterium]